jgi:hypothetical protein
MTKTHWTLTAIALIVTVLLAAWPAQAAQGAKLLNEELPQIVMPLLKAVLIVGPIDGDPDWTKAEIDHMELAAIALKNHGVEVYRFYTPNNDWDQIKQAASGAQFLLYRGHGILWNPNPEQVGGIDLNDMARDGQQLMISPERIRSELHLARNAIVMLYGCYTTGSAGGEGAITTSVAERRVAQYSDAFLAAGAAGYFANWYGDAFQKWIDLLFSGKTLGEVYQDYQDTHIQTVLETTHPNYPSLAMWLDTDIQSNITIYNNAFVGNASARLIDLFGVNLAGMKPRLYLPVLMR